MIRLWVDTSQTDWQITKVMLVRKSNIQKQCTVDVHAYTKIIEHMLTWVAVSQEKGNEDKPGG